MAAVSTVTNRRRILAGFMGMLFLCAMLFSAFYIAAESHHDCEGEDCPICRVIAANGAIFRLSGLVLLLLFFLRELREAGRFQRCGGRAFFVSPRTPVGWKTRLNN